MRWVRLCTPLSQTHATQDNSSPSTMPLLPGPMSSQKNTWKQVPLVKSRVKDAGFEKRKKKQDKTFYTNSKSAGCRKKKCNVLKKRGQRNSTSVIQMKTPRVFEEEIMVLQ